MPYITQNYSVNEEVLTLIVYSSQQQIIRFNSINFNTQL